MNNSQVKSLRICFVGDSFVNGTGDPECLGWVGRICAAAQQQGHDITCYNLGHSSGYERCYCAPLAK